MTAARATTDREVVRQNRRAWDFLARTGNSASDPWADDATPGELRSWVDELQWLPWNEVRSVLVLCGAGGQQAPSFARLGLTVTVVDLSAEQLALDRQVAEQFGVSIETVRADVRNLAETLSGRTFDLVYQPASTCYLPDPRECYRGVARVLKPGGLYYSEHWNPAQVQLGAIDRWDGSAYRVKHRSGTGEGIDVTHPSLAGGPSCVYFAHRTSDLIGGICDAGFVLEKFGERGEANLTDPPDTPGHVGSYLPSFFAVLARRTDGGEAERVVPQASTVRTTPALVRPPANLAGATRRLERRGFAILRDVLDPEELLPALEAEALAQREATEHVTTCHHYGIGHDGSYVSGFMSFSSAHPGPMLRRLHANLALRDLVRSLTGDDTMRRSGNLSYMFYDAGSHIDVHTDLPGCGVTLLTSVVGRTPPLIAYPRLHGITPQALLPLARRTKGKPPGGVSLEVPVGGLLMIDGRRLPHRRPVVAEGQGPYAIAALCFRRPR